MSVVLFTEWFWPENEHRQQELSLALTENLRVSWIDKVIVWAESAEGIDHLECAKLDVLYPTVRPSYEELFSLARNDYPDSIVIIANNDISFKSCSEISMTSGVMYCLSRYELVKGQAVCLDAIEGRDSQWSQDSWVVIGRDAPHVGKFLMGTPGCDNRLAYECYMAGLILENPWERYVTLHYHSEISRNYQNDRLPCPYVFVSGKSATLIYHWRRFPFHADVSLFESALVKNIFLSRSSLKWLVYILFRYGIRGIKRIKLN